MGPIQPSPGQPVTPKRPKLGKNILTCSGLLAGVLVLFLVFFVYLISSIGAVQLPLLNKLYSPPSPARLINYAPLDMKDFEALISSKVREKIRQGEKKITIEVNERELSGLLGWGLGQGLRRQMQVQHAQVLILPTSLELYIQLKWGLGRLDLLAHVKPVLQPDGSVKFEPLNFQLGSINLPSWLVAPVVSNIFSQDLGAWNLQAGDMKIDSIVLSSEKISITFK